MRPASTRTWRAAREGENGSGSGAGEGVIPGLEVAAGDAGPDVAVGDAAGPAAGPGPQAESETSAATHAARAAARTLARTLKSGPPDADVNPMKLRRSRRFVATIALTGALFASSLAIAPSAGAALRPNERQLARLVNRARRQHGLAGLRLSGRLSRIARVHSRGMARTNYLYHSDLGSVCARTGCHHLAENVAWAWSVRGLHRKFVNSSPHLHNMLGPDRKVGIGIVHRGNKLWATEIFWA